MAVPRSVTFCAVLVALALAAPSASAATSRIAIGAGGNEQITPSRSVVIQGDTVVFDWEDGGHDLVLAGPASTRVGRQDEGFRLTRKLDQAGSYTLVCTLHDNMKAELTVAPDPASAQPAAPPAVDVVVGPDGSNGLEPADVTVTRGQTVNWHWGNSNVALSFDDGPISGQRSIGDFWGRTFTSPGTYPYRASSGAAGTVTVVEPGATTTSGIGSALPGSAPSAEITVGAGGNSFAPSAVTIDEGSSVRFTWAGGPHNVRFEDGTDSGFRSSGADDRAFYSPGTFSFLCSAHAGMTGSVKVNDTGAPGPNATPPGNGADAVSPTPTGGPVGGSDLPSPADGVGVGGASNALSQVVFTPPAAGAPAGVAVDSVAPALRGVRATFRSGRRSHSLRLIVTEDARLEITLRAIGRSRDLVAERSLKLYARKGATTLRLPTMNLTARRYRLRIVAVDRAGNRSAAQHVVIGLRG